MSTTVIAAVTGPFRTFELKRPMVLNLEPFDGSFKATHSKLAVCGYGSSEEEAMEDFCEAFEVQWEALVECSSECLTEAARREAQNMRDVVRAYEGEMKQ